MSDGPAGSTSRRGLIVFEIGAVLTVYWLPMLVTSVEFFAYGTGSSAIGASSTLSLWNQTITKLALTPFLFLLAWRGAGSLKRFYLDMGTRWAGLLVVPIYFLDRTVTWIGMVAASAGPDGPTYAQAFIARPSIHADPSLSHVAALIVYVTIAVFLEEYVFRGYLISRLIDLTGKPWLAVVLSSALFASFHIYQGLPRVFVVFLAGLIYAGTMRVTRSIWPAFFAHWAVDAILGLTQMGVFGRAH